MLREDGAVLPGLRVRGAEAAVTQAASLLESLGALAALAPQLVASELRPLVVSLEARRRTCAACGTIFLGKARSSRSRFFCGDLCRLRDYRETHNGQPALRERNSVDRRA